MSQPFSRFLHPFDTSSHPTLEPEVKRAILASWASERSAICGQPVPRKPADAKRAVSIEEILAAMPAVDRPPDAGSLLQ
ncbi:hypothetical protein WBP07_21335 (plasmid) [Novosphingobium sp. BL-8A]|uniref:hypothetical protein n=1 Tax=Novosphingobium sp. BL-8A TaxID=3127639 RepID=UPI003757C120